MRLRNIKGADEVIESNRFVIQKPESTKGKWKEVFGNKNPVYIEIGMGKGQFICALAKQNPSINYIGIEKYASVLLRALQKVEQEPIENLRFIRMDAACIEEVFAKEEVDKIYLNFSDPWPKDRHAKRRLPSKEFLTRFDMILSSEGMLEFKTDNRGLFDFAVEELPAAHWFAEQITYNLHNDPVLAKGNIMTEYEEKFAAAGNPIYQYNIRRNYSSNN